MIALFPDPLPDELLYSICARYRDRTNYPNKQFTSRELFGSYTGTAIIGLPSYLSQLIENLPPWNKRTVDVLIDENTLLPFYAPFLPADRVSRIRMQMQGSDSARVQRMSGNNTSNIRTPDWLRFCPVCVNEDRERFGESYWHRLHQISGVQVCPTHFVFLENSRARARNRVNKREYLSAEHILQPTSPRPLNKEDFRHDVLLRIARDVQWLLGQRGLAPGYISLHQRYTFLLANKGLVTINGQIAISKLSRAIMDYYSKDLLEVLQCDFNNSRFNQWPFFILRKLKKAKGQHPLRHLLLIQFLQSTAKEFFSLSPVEDTPFGDGPWPCLNPACEYFMQLQINQCDIRYVRRYSKSNPVGMFNCICGFNYIRKGPDQLPADIFRFHRVKSFGPLWEAAFRSYWNDPTLTMSDIHRRLCKGPSLSVVKRHAERLELPFPRKGPDNKLVHKMKSSLAKQKETRPTKVKSEDYKEEWLHALESNPGVLRTFLTRQFRRSYRWLKSNEPEWLEAHLPPIRRPLSRRVDWESRDVELAEKIRLAANVRKNSPGRPIRVTKSLISRDIGSQGILNKENHRLPLTSQALRDTVETRIDFAIRRLNWAADCFRQERRKPSRPSLLRCASINEDIQFIPEIIRLVDQLLESLETSNSVNPERAA